jgi:hypothetical protein
MADPLFELANHTWEHRNLRIVADAELKNEIQAPQIVYAQLWKDLAARQCLTNNRKSFAHEHASKRLSLFRFPFGACNPTSLEAVANEGLRPIQWDVSSGDSTPTFTVEQVAAGVISSVTSGSIVLFHANGRGWKTARALPIIVAALRKRRFKFVTVTELINYPGADPDVRPYCFDSRPGDTDRYDTFSRHLHSTFKSFSDRMNHLRSEDHTGVVPPAPVPATRNPATKEMPIGQPR